MRIRLIQLTMLIAMVSLIGGVLSAQMVTSSITGTVRDTSGAIVPGASVIVRDLARGVSRSVTTNSAGSYLFSDLPAGTYTLTVVAHGFTTYRAAGIILQAARQIRADAILQVGSVATQVTVQGSSIGQVQTQTSQLGGTVTGRQINQLELNGRAYTQLIELVPGVANATGTDQGQVGGNSANAYSINGGRTVYNNFEIDGVQNEDTGSMSNLLTLYPSIDAIGEERILTSNYGAQYGQSTSGIVIATTKSGTSQFHGDAYEFNRNTVFDARNFFESTRGTLNQNDFGYTLGGPVYIPGHYNTDKTKTFFFWSQEWRRYIAPSTFNIQLPSTQERQGNFSDVCPNAVTGSFADCPKNPATGTYFPGNQVPIDPNAQALMSLIPAPNSGSGPLSFFRENPSFPTDWREELVRVDQNITSKVRLMAHYIHDSWNTDEPTTIWNGSSFPNINTVFGEPATNVVLQLTTSISPTLMNEVIFGYNVNHITFVNNHKNLWQVPDSFTMKGIFPNGFGGVLPGVSICCNAQDAGGGGFFEDAGGNVVPFTPNYNSNPVYTFRDLVTKIAGNHNLVLGADFIADQKNELSSGASNVNGILTFSNTSAVSTGNAFADFLTGNIANYLQLNNVVKYYDRRKSLSAYVQDDWHVRPHLTLNLGFRADFTGWFSNKYNQSSNFEPMHYNPADAPEIDVTGSITGQAGALVPGVGNPFDGLVRCGVNGAPPECVQIHYFNPAPRVGFAWDPTGHGTTAIRGGYGIYYINISDVKPESLNGTPPLEVNPSIFNVVGYENVGGTALQFPLSGTALETYVTWPSQQQWNLDVQHNLGANTVLSVAYVGSKGTHLSDVRNLNQLSPLPLSENPFGPGQPITSANCGPPLTGPTGQPVSGQEAVRLGIACGNNPDPYRPFIGFGNIRLRETEANSNYNALQAYVRRAAGPLTFSLAYTYSHSLDNSSDVYDNTFVNSFDLERGYATSDFDFTHVIAGSYVYELPFFQHSSSRLLRYAVGGWEVSGIATFETGSPFSVLNGVFGDNAGVANGTGVGSFPDICGNIHAAPLQTNIAGVIGPLLYNPSGFCAPTGLTFGNAGRNILRNPGFTTWDLGLFKNIPIYKERAYLQFRTEVFNAFNTASLFISPAGGLGSAVPIPCYAGANNSAGAPSCIAGSSFLHVGGAHDPRIFQFALKLIF